MDDDELHARFAGLRLAIAYAIKAASRSPADFAHHVEALREIGSLTMGRSHPAAKEELDGVIRALIHLPIRDPAHTHPTMHTSHPEIPKRDVATPLDLLS